MMRLLLAGIAVALAGHSHAQSAPKHSTSKPAPAPAPAPAYVRPAPPLPMQPRVGRVLVEAAADRVVVVQDVVLPKGDWQSGGLDLYVAFGAPGVPIAIDARLIAPSPGGLDARPEETGELVVLEHVPRRSVRAQQLLGPSQMAGVAVHVKEVQLRRIYAAGEYAVLRIRSLLMAPAADATTGARDVVVRLGAVGGLPLTLGRVQVASLEAQPWITRAEASLCGPDADTSWPLTVTVIGKAPGAPRIRSRPTIAPEMAVRHATDDLCIRWWGGP
jgi:hypothetical protein